MGRTLAMNLLILSSHAILEYDDLRMFTDLGYDTFVLGAYTDPAHPGVEFGEEPFRPPVPQASHHADLAALCQEQRVRHAELGEEVGNGIVDWAKADIHPDVVAWADVIMVNCFPATWIGGQWDAIKHKRVIWRTIGQSNPRLEIEMRQLKGLEIVRYSPAERRAFEPLGAFAGEDAMIRFCKYPADYEPWIGDNAVVGNVTQNLTERGDHCGLTFWEQATRDLPTLPAGLGSERLPNGLGTLSYRAMLDYLSHLRVYLYMGTQPASYTLGLMEAMLAGVPVLSMGPDSLWMPELFEGHELSTYWAPDAEYARRSLRTLLDTADTEASTETRQRAIDLFSPEVVGPQWLKFLGNPARVTMQGLEAIA
jgi:hypothetical protein